MDSDAMKLTIFYDGFDKSNFLFIDSTSQISMCSE